MNETGNPSSLSSPGLDTSNRTGAYNTDRDADSTHRGLGRLIDEYYTRDLVDMDSHLTEDGPGEHRVTSDAGSFQMNRNPHDRPPSVSPSELSVSLTATKPASAAGGPREDPNPHLAYQNQPSGLAGSNLPALPGLPPAAYISAAAAAAFLSDHASSSTIPSAAASPAPGSTGGEARSAPSTGFSLEAISMVNAFLDHILLSIIAGANSPAIADLRLAVHSVLKARLAAAATVSAEEEIRGLIDSEGEEDSLGIGKGPASNQTPTINWSNWRSSKDEDSTEISLAKSALFGGLSPPKNWLIQARFRRLRLRIMVYAQLGDVEELDEQQYLSNPSADEYFLESLGLSDGLAAIFLANVLEHIAEQALLAVFSTAASRSRADRSRAVFVEEKDVQKLSLNGTLGRLFRTFRRGKDVFSGIPGTSTTSVASVRSLSAMSGAFSSCGSLEDGFPIPPSATSFPVILSSPPVSSPGMVNVESSFMSDTSSARPDVRSGKAGRIESESTTPTFPFRLSAESQNSAPASTSAPMSRDYSTSRKLIPLILPSHNVIDPESRKQHSRSSSLPFRRLPDKSNWTPVSPRSPAIEFFKDKSSDDRAVSGSRMGATLTGSSTNSTSRLVLEESPGGSKASLSPHSDKVAPSSQDKARLRDSSGNAGGNTGNNSLRATNAMNTPSRISIDQATDDSTLSLTDSGQQNRAGSTSSSIRRRTPSSSKSSSVDDRAGSTSNRPDLSISRRSASPDDFVLTMPANGTVGVAHTSDRTIETPVISGLAANRLSIVASPIQRSGSLQSLGTSRRSSRRISVPSSIATGRDSPVLMPDPEESDYTSDEQDDQDSAAERDRHDRIYAGTPVDNHALGIEAISLSPGSIGDEQRDLSETTSEDAPPNLTGAQACVPSVPEPAQTGNSGSSKRRPPLGINPSLSHSSSHRLPPPPLSPVLERPASSNVDHLADATVRANPIDAVFTARAELAKKGSAVQATTGKSKPSPPMPIWDFDSELRLSEETKRYKIVSGTLRGVSGDQVDAETESDRLGLLDRDGQERERERDITHIAMLSKQAGISLNLNRNRPFSPKDSSSNKENVGQSLKHQSLESEQEALSDFAKFLSGPKTSLNGEQSRVNGNEGGLLGKAKSMSSPSRSESSGFGHNQTDPFSLTSKPQTTTGAKADPSMDFSDVGGSTLLSNGSTNEAREESNVDESFATSAVDTYDASELRDEEPDDLSSLGLGPVRRSKKSEGQSLMEFLNTTEPAESQAVEAPSNSRTLKNLLDIPKPAKKEKGKKTRRFSNFDGTGRGIFGLRSRKSQISEPQSQVMFENSLRSPLTGTFPVPPTHARSETETSVNGAGATSPAWPLRSHPTNGGSMVSSPILDTSVLSSATTEDRPAPAAPSPVPTKPRVVMRPRSPDCGGRSTTAELADFFRNSSPPLMNNRMANLTMNERSSSPISEASTKNAKRSWRKKLTR